MVTETISGGTMGSCWWGHGPMGNSDALILNVYQSVPHLFRLCCEGGSEENTRQDSGGPRNITVKEGETRYRSPCHLSATLLQELHSSIIRLNTLPPHGLHLIWNMRAAERRRWLLEPSNLTQPICHSAVLPEETAIWIGPWMKSGIGLHVWVWALNCHSLHVSHIHHVQTLHIVVHWRNVKCKI